MQFPICHFAIFQFRLFTALLLVLVASSSTRSYAEEQRLLETPDKWMQVGGDDKSFTFADGQLNLNRGDNEPSDILTREDYENYELEFDCRLPDWCVSGLLLNVPRNGAHRAGLEIELNNVETARPLLTSAGAIFRKRVPNTMAMKPRGEWNHVYVKLDWPYLFVKINEQVVQDVDLTDNWVTRNSLRRGAIGFQNLGIPMQVKNFVVRRLPDTEQGIELFNGRDLTG